MKNIMLNILILIFLVGCFHQDKSDNSSRTWKGEINKDGFPEVQGRYSFNTDDFVYTCSDGAEGKVGGISLNLVIEQNENSFTIINSNSSSITPGFDVIEESDTVGNIKRNGEFLATKTVTSTQVGFVGTNTVRYNTDGHFTFEGWKGDYLYTVFFTSYGITCEYKTTFDGELISKNISKVDIEIPRLEYKAPESYMNTYGETFGYGM